MLLDKTGIMPPVRHPDLTYSDQKQPPLETLEESAIEEKFASSRCAEEFKKVFKIFVPPLQTKKGAESNIQLGAEGTKQKGKGGRPRKKPQQITLEEAVHSQMDDSNGSIKSEMLVLKPIQSKKPTKGGKKKQDEEVKEGQIEMPTNPKVSKRLPKLAAQNQLKQF